MRAQLARRDGVAQLAVILGVVGGYLAARSAMEPDWGRALANAERIVSYEQSLGLAWEQSLQRAFLALPDLVQLLNVFVGHFLLTGIFFLWLYHRSRDGFRSFRDGFIVATALSAAIHWLYPSAPPRLADVGLDDTLLLLSGIDIGSPASAALSNPVAAVPSLHAAYAIGVGFGLWHFARTYLVRAAGVLYPPLVVLTIVVTGNHFLLDAVAGLAVLAVGFAVAAWLRARSSFATIRPASRGGAVR